MGSYLDYVDKGSVHVLHREAGPYAVVAPAADVVVSPSQILTSV